MRLDPATVLLQWAVGGMAFCWFTTRRRVAGPGYGWLLRIVYGVLALGAFGVAQVSERDAWRDAAALATAASCFAVLAVSVARRHAGVSGQLAEHDRRRARVAAMAGIEPTGSARSPARGELPPPGAPAGTAGPEFPPWLDLVPVAVGAFGLVAAGVGSGVPVPLALLRLFAGAAFLGAVTDAMLLGHWYLTQPGLPRSLLHELVNAVGVIWPVEVIALLIPVGMVSVWTGAVDDGWGGTLGWFWAACAATTIVLVVVTKAALRERQYSAVMAATGLLYLAILTAFGTDLVARAVLAG